MAGVTDTAGRRGPGPRRRGALAGPGAVPRRPGLRRRDHRGDAGVHRVPARHRRSRRERSSRTTRSTPTSTSWRGPTRRTAGCSRRVPSVMIFDDHDIRDDWNTSQAWKDEMEATSWWHGRIVAGLASYWVYQHLGNMTPAERAEDEIWQRDRRPRRRRRVRPVRRARRVRRPGRPEARELPLELCAGVRRPGAAGRRGLARGAGAGPRQPLDARRRRDGLARRADARRRRPPADRHLAAVPAGARPALRRGVQRGAGRRGAGVRAAAKAGETIRQAVDLEHWAAFQDGFQKVAAMALEVARGERGRAPRDRDVPVRRRAPQLRLRGRPDPAGERGRTADRRAGSSRRSARRSATRCRASGASRRRSCPTAWPGRSATWSPAPPRSRTRR